MRWALINPFYFEILFAKHLAWLPWDTVLRYLGLDPWMRNSAVHAVLPIICTFEKMPKLEFSPHFYKPVKQGCTNFMHAPVDGL